jgi:hypothetical protein
LDSVHPAYHWIFHAFQGISEQKATGLGAIAGGVAEAYAIFGLFLAFVLPVAAIVLLVKSFSAGHSARALFSLLYICWSVLTLAFAVLSVWFFFHLPAQAASGPR